MVKLCFSKVSDIKTGLLYGHFPSHIPGFFSDIYLEKQFLRL